MTSFLTRYDNSKNRTVINWSQTYSCQPKYYYEPRNVEEIRVALKNAVSFKKQVRCIGSAASPSDIFCTDDVIIDLRRFNNVLAIDVTKKTIKVEAGITLGGINAALDEKRLAMSVLPAIPTITIGGILGTGVHGSGRKHGMIADYVTELELLLANGDIIECNNEKNRDIFKSALLNLGALGVVVSVTLQCEQSFNLKQTATSFPFSHALDLIDQENKENKGGNGKYLYYPHVDQIVQIAIDKTEEEPFPERTNLIWTIARQTGFLQFFFLLCVVFFKQLVPLCFRLVHFVLFRDVTQSVDKNFNILHFDCLFSQHVSEWAIPIESTRAFLTHLRNTIISRDIMAHGPIEIRFTKASDVFLSPTFGRDTTYINIVMFRPFGFEPKEKEDYWEVFESLVLAYEGRPHWAKVHPMQPELFAKTYPHFVTFQKIREELDPEGLFVNSYIKRHVLGENTC